MRVKLAKLLEGYVDVTYGRTIATDALHNHMKKFIKTKGIWKTVDENINDIFYVQSDGKIVCGNTTYPNLEVLVSDLKRSRASISQFSARNGVGRSRVLNILEDFLKSNSPSSSFPRFGQ